MHARRPAKIRSDLHFVPAAESDAAVAPFFNVVFGMQLEIPVLLSRHQIVRVAPARQDAVFHGPAFRVLRPDASPAGQVLTIKKDDWLSFDPGAVVMLINCGRTLTCKSEVLGAGYSSFELAVDISHLVVHMM